MAYATADTQGVVMYVYFIVAMSHPKRIKVGKAKDPEQRMKALQTGCPYKLSLRSVIKCRDDRHAFAMERAMHELLKNERKQGEWFRCTDYLLARMMDVECTMHDLSLKAL